MIRGTHKVVVRAKETGNVCVPSLIAEAHRYEFRKWGRIEERAKMSPVTKLKVTRRGKQEKKWQRKVEHAEMGSVAGLEIGSIRLGRSRYRSKGEHW